MYKVLAVTVLCCLALQAAGDDADRCSGAYILQTCLPNYQQILPQSQTVNSLTALTVATNSTGFLAKCPRFIAFEQCADPTFEQAGCTVPTDAANPNIVRFRAASAAIKVVCVEKASEFAAARECLSSEAVRQAVQVCANAADSHGSSARRRRHTCSDYSTEVNCAGAAVRSLCPDIAADFFSFIGKLLRSTVHTALCTEPTVLTN